MSDFKSTNGARTFAEIVAKHLPGACHDTACLCAVAVLVSNIVIAAYFGGWGWALICTAGLISFAWRAKP